MDADGLDPQFRTPRVGARFVAVMQWMLPAAFALVGLVVLLVVIWASTVVEADLRGTAVALVIVVGTVEALLIVATALLIREYIRRRPAPSRRRDDDRRGDDATDD